MPSGSENDCVLDSIDLDIYSGEIFGLLGANGAGKTTLVEILATQLLPSAGNARILGHNIVDEVNLVRHLIGYAPASTDSFYPRLSVRVNLEFFSALYDQGAVVSKSRIQELIALVGLDQVQHKSFQQLSLGMKQRLGLARALLTDPPLLLLDEPTRSLDPFMQRSMHRFLRESIARKPNLAVLLVTHNFQEVETVCDRVAILSRGRIAACGQPAEIVSAAKASNLAEAFEHYVGHQIEIPEVGMDPDREWAV